VPCSGLWDRSIRSNASTWIPRAPIVALPVLGKYDRLNAPPFPPCAVYYRMGKHRVLCKKMRPKNHAHRCHIAPMRSRKRRCRIRGICERLAPRKAWTCVSRLTRRIDQNWLSLAKPRSEWRWWGKGGFVLGGVLGRVGAWLCLLQHQFVCAGSLRLGYDLCDEGGGLLRTWQYQPT
jgi:hypothetical protein